MALPVTGTIKFSDLNIELGRSSTAEISLSTAFNGGYIALNDGCSPVPSATDPDSLSEWYSYDQCCNLGTFAQDTTGTLADNCAAYSVGIVIVYSNNCGEMASSCTLYSTDGGACSGTRNVYCFTDYNSYWCTNSSGVVTSTGACST